MRAGTTFPFTMLHYVHVAAFGISRYGLPCPLAGSSNQWASTLFTELSMNTVRKLVSKKELKSVYGVPYSPAHIARLEKAEKFPCRVVLGLCRVAWFADEIEAWIASRPRAA
jgi:prophage regulatory protein